MFMPLFQCSFVIIDFKQIVGEPGLLLLMVFLEREIVMCLSSFTCFY